jgi:hypothetical protein
VGPLAVLAPFRVPFPPRVRSGICRARCRRQKSTRSAWFAVCISPGCWCGSLSGNAFKLAASQKFGDNTGHCHADCMVQVACCQFHFVFYASRPLPNTRVPLPWRLFFPPTTFAWLNRQHKKPNSPLAFAMAAFGM